MSTILQVILSSISGVVIGSLFYGIITGGIIFILYKIDESGGGWVGVIQNPVLLASIFGAIIGGVFGFLTGLVIGLLKITELLRGALIGFAVTEITMITFFVVFSLIDFSHSSNFSRLSESIISSFFSFLFLSLFLLIPSVIVGIGTVKINDLIRSILNLQS